VLTAFASKNRSAESQEGRSPDAGSDTHTERSMNG
jgi:hypothetical protein